MSGQQALISGRHPCYACMQCSLNNFSQSSPLGYSSLCINIVFKLSIVEISKICARDLSWPSCGIFFSTCSFVEKGICLQRSKLFILHKTGFVDEAATLSSQRKNTKFIE